MLDTTIQTNNTNSKHFSWGNILLLTFLAFMMLMAVMVYSAVNTRFDLVSKDYYKDELRYQEKIDGVANASSISNLLIAQSANSITIQLPEEMKQKVVDGTIWLYYKTDARKDKKIKLNLNENAAQAILKENIFKGTCQVKINWNVGSKLYYVEKEIIVF